MRSRLATWRGEMSKPRQESFSVAREIDRLEEKLSRCREALEEVDFKLRRKELTPEGRKSLEKEKIVLAARAEDYEKELKMLHRANHKNAALSIALLVLVVVIYVCWTM